MKNKTFDQIHGSRESFMDVLGKPKIFKDLSEFRNHQMSISNAGSTCDTDWINKGFTEYRMTLLLRIPRKDTVSEEDAYTTIWKGEYDSYVEIIYKCDELPQGFSEEEKKMFEKVTLELPFSQDKTKLKKVDVFQYRGGRDISNCDWTQKRRSSRVASEISKLFYPQSFNLSENENDEEKEGFKGTIFHELSECVDFLEGKKFVFLAGAGASAELLSFGTQCEDELGQLRTPNLIKNGGIDPMVRSMMNEEGRKRIVDVFNRGLFLPIIEERKSAVHSEIAEIAFHFNTQILTTNFDFLFELSGIEPLKIVTNRQIENLIRMEDYEKIDIIICVGIGADRKNVLSYFRKMNPKGVVISFDMNEVTYLEDKDFLVKGDFINDETIRKLKEKMLI